VVGDQQAHELLAFAGGHGVAIVAPGHVAQRLAEHHHALLRIGPVMRHGAALRKIAVAGLRQQGCAIRRLRLQLQAVAERRKQRDLETPQHAALERRRRQIAQRVCIGVENLFVGIVTRERGHQQLVEIETAKQRRPGELRNATLPLDAVNEPHLGSTRPRHQQRLKRQQHRTQLGLRAPGPFGHRRQAPVPARQEVDDEAGLLPGSRMQHERWFVRDPLLGAARRSRPAPVGAIRHSRIFSAGAGHCSSRRPPAHGRRGRRARRTAAPCPAGPLWPCA